MKRGHFALFHRSTIRVGGEPYLVRWRLVQTPWFAVYLHHILRSDDDRALHDHPFSFASLILRGGYYEVLPDGCHWRGAGSIVFHRAEDLHRLLLDRPAWTLVLCGRRRREWGFGFADGWRSWRAVSREAAGVKA